VSYMHPGGTRNRMSGTTMQANVPRSEWLRRQRIMQVMPGFPAEPFQTIEDVEAHIGGEKVVCLLCGKYYENVLRHVAVTHGLDGKDYRHQFNIPAKYSLAGSRLSEVRRSVSSKPEHKQHISRQRPKRPRTGKRSPLIKHDWNKKRHEDFSWHLEQARTIYYRLLPPPNQASWSAFQKRLATDAKLRQSFVEARSEWRKKRS
jgi:hypothetical protein